MKIEFNNHVVECNSVLLVPEKALESPEYILTFSEDNRAATKHQFHAMAQVTYYQYQDDEIDVQPVGEDVVVRTDTRTEKLLAGICIFRDDQGTLWVLSRGTVNVKKLLEATYRFCTRWVRLDI